MSFHRFARRILCSSALVLSPTLAWSAPHELAQPAVLEGHVVVTVAEYPDHSVTRHTLQTATGDVELLLDENATVQTGSTIRVSGQRAGSLMAAATGSVATVAPAPSALTLGAQKTLVMLVNFTDNTSQPVTVADAQKNVFTDANNYYLENSYGLTSLTGDVVGWYMLPIASTCDTNSIGTAAKQAATAAGVNLSAYNHYIYVHPSVSGCPIGISTVGGNPSETWLNGDMSLQYVAHELGHSFGLNHSHNLDCGATVIGTSCAVGDYGDVYDVMGTNGVHHFNAFQKERLGFLGYGSSPAITTVQSSGTYTIEPLENASAGNAKALKILKSTDPTTGARTWYYVEFRQALGYDSALSTTFMANYQNGVFLHLGTDNSGNSSDLLNMTPQSITGFDWYDSALVVGKTYADSAAGVTIAPVAASAAGISVSVTLSAPAQQTTCTHANPKVTLTGSGQSVGAGSTLSYTISVTNQDSSGCVNSTFNLSDVLPSGWSGSLAAASLTVAPGASASATLSVTSPSTATAGTYNLSTSATSNGYQATATSTYTVASTSSKKPHH